VTPDRELGASWIRFRPTPWGRSRSSGCAVKSVEHARGLGIDTVFQDLALINELSVPHDMFPGRKRVRWPY
jgi:ABC-type sugar transport system ATPase subunit